VLTDAALAVNVYTNGAPESSTTLPGLTPMLMVAKSSSLIATL
jgi:hypothetical protein